MHATLSVLGGSCNTGLVIRMYDSWFCRLSLQFKDVVMVEHYLKTSNRKFYLDSVHHAASKRCSNKRQQKNLPFKISYYEPVKILAWTLLAQSPSLYLICWNTTLLRFVSALETFATMMSWEKVQFRYCKRFQPLSSELLTNSRKTSLFHLPKKEILRIVWMLKWTRLPVSKM